MVSEPSVRRTPEANPENSLHRPAATTSRVTLDHPTNTNSWAFPPALTDHHAVSGHPSAMIGPTPSFYDSEEAPAVTPETTGYQQWLTSYEPGQQPQYIRSTHERPAQFPPQQLGPATVPRASQPLLQNQYNFVQAQYTPPTHTTPTQHYGSSSSVQGGQRAGQTGMHSTSSYASGMTGDHYFYSGTGSPPTPSGDPSQQSQSFNSWVTSPRAQPQPQQPQRRQTNHLQIPQAQYHPSPSKVTMYTPTSDVGPSLAHSSASPASWTEEAYPHAAPSDTNVTTTQTHTTQPMTGKRSRGPPTASSKTVTAKPKSRKRQRKNDGAAAGPAAGYRDSESDSEDDGYEGGGNAQAGSTTRLPGACTHCKKLKMKCDFPKNENTCKRCKAGGHQCIVEGRKPRTAPNKREYLLAQIRQKDAIIESLLKQLHDPYTATPLSIASYRMATSPSDQNNSNIIAWLDRLQASLRTPAGYGEYQPFKLDARAQLGGNAEGGNNEEEGSDTMSEHAGEAGGADGDGGEEGCVDGTDEKMGGLPDDAVPLGLIAHLALSNNKARGSRRETLDDDNVGVANETYFMPGPATDLNMRATMIEQHSPPEILVHGLVTPEDVEKLFEIFYERINPFVSLLDPVLHTPASTFARCPFLFTVICAVSSRYYTEKSEIYPIAMHFAKHAAASALTDGWKSVELCQAYILMSVYAVPAKRWEEDRSWLYTGLAIRIATDLNLHQVPSAKPANEQQEREILNRTRVWMSCFNLDRSTATQFGKPSTIKEDYVVRNSTEWYKKSQYNLPYDLHLSAYSSLLRIVARFHEEIFSDPEAPTGLNKDVDFRAVTVAHEETLSVFHQEWQQRFEEESDSDDRSSVFRCSLLPFLVSYSRLVMFSFGFQQAFARGIQPGDHIFFDKCLDAAKSVISHMIENLAPSGYMRYAPDGHFIYATFASAFLLKLLRPELANLLTNDQEREIFELIGRLIQTLSSPDVSVDDRHTPKLHARFLAGLLHRHRRDGSAVSGRLQPQPPQQTQLHHTSESNFGVRGHTTSSGQSTFSVAPPQGGLHERSDGGYTHTMLNPAEKCDTPIYMPDTTYGSGAGTLDFGQLGDLGPYGLSSINGFSEDEALASMKTLKNPLWWQNVMMPGFSWHEAPMTHHEPYIQNINMPSLHHGLGGYHATEVALH